RDSLDRAADQHAALGHIDGLLLDGGAVSGWRSRTAEGLPLSLATHVVANAALTARLLPTVIASGTAERPSRIVHTSTGFVDRARRIRLDGPRRAPRLGVVAYPHAKALTQVPAVR